jgi:aquaporin Z
MRNSDGGWKYIVRRHWHLYLFEGAELGIFMLSACCFDVLLYCAASPAASWIGNATLRGLLMGASMGGTAVLIIHSGMGKRSGAHFNPAITLTYLWLGKIHLVDALFYILGQFLGGAAGVGIASLFLGNLLVAPPVRYVVTVPGVYGVAGAFAAEFFMAALLMGTVLWTSNRPALARFTGYLVGVLITFYVLIFGRISGFSINPARTVASAVFAHIWTGWWIYFIAPLMGMLFVAAVYVMVFRREGILCAKLHHAPSELSRSRFHEAVTARATIPSRPPQQPSTAARGAHLATQTHQQLSPDRPPCAPRSSRADAPAPLQGCRPRSR